MNNSVDLVRFDFELKSQFPERGLFPDVVSKLSTAKELLSSLVTNTESYWSSVTSAVRSRFPTQYEFVKNMYPNSFSTSRKIMTIAALTCICGTFYAVRKFRKASVHPIENLRPIVFKIDAPKNENDDTGYSFSEISKHTSLNVGIWLVIANKVYDVSAFIKGGLHPSNIDFILRHAGKDCTNVFKDIHSDDAHMLLEKYCIGDVTASEATAYVPSNKYRSRRVSINYDNFYSSAGSPMSVQELFIFPVKSCGGIALSRCNMLQSGFENDRIYAFYIKKTRTAINQLTYPLLCKIQTATIDPTDADNYDKDSFSKGVRFYFPADPDHPIDVPLIMDKPSEIQVKWRSTPQPIFGYDQGPAIANKITEYLRRDDDETAVEFGLLRIDSVKSARFNQGYFYIPSLENEEQPISAIQNYSAVNLASQESLDELNRRFSLKNPKSAKSFGMDRFRVNIVINRVCEPYFEDLMKEIIISPPTTQQQLGRLLEDEDDQKFDLTEVKKNAIDLVWCRRRYFCPQPDVVQETGEVNPEMREAVESSRNAITLNDRYSPPGDNAIFFGSFFIIKTFGCISIGDEVRADLHLDFLTIYHKYELLEKTQVTRDSALFRFGHAQTKKYEHLASLTLDAGDHWLIRMPRDKENVLMLPSSKYIIRAYTPIIYNVLDDENSSETKPRPADVDCFDLLIKVYPDGQLTPLLDKLKIGDFIEAKKEAGHTHYAESGKVSIGYPERPMASDIELDCDHLNLIAGGTGIAPIYQILCHIHLNQLDKVKVSCIFANRTEKDILLHEELLHIHKIHNNISVYFTVDKLESQTGWAYGVGYVSRQMVADHLFAANESNCVNIMSGPPSMLNMVQSYLEQAGFNQNQIHEF